MVQALPSTVPLRKGHVTPLLTGSNRPRSHPSPWPELKESGATLHVDTLGTNIDFISVRGGEMEPVQPYTVSTGSGVGIVGFWGLGSGLWDRWDRRARTGIPAQVLGDLSGYGNSGHWTERKTRDPYSFVNDSLIMRTHCTVLL